MKTLTGKPVTMVINTDTDYDDTNGQVEFRPRWRSSRTSNTNTFMEKANPVYGAADRAAPNIFTANGGAACRSRTFTDRMTHPQGADRIDLYHFGRAHTGGDTYVVFPALHVMHVGDTFPTATCPSWTGTTRQRRRLLRHPAKAAAVAGVKTIINGDSPTTMTPADVKTYSEFIGDFVAAVQAAKKAGKTVDDVVASWTTPAKYAGYAAPTPARVKANAAGRSGPRRNERRFVIGRAASGSRGLAGAGAAPAAAQPPPPAAAAREHQGARPAGTAREVR